MKISDDQIDKLADLLAKKVVERLKDDIIPAVIPRGEGGIDQWRGQEYLDHTELAENGVSISAFQEAQQHIKALIQRKKRKRQ